MIRNILFLIVFVITLLLPKKTHAQIIPDTPSEQRIVIEVSDHSSTHFGFPDYQIEILESPDNFSFEDSLVLEIRNQNLIGEFYIYIFHDGAIIEHDVTPDGAVQPVRVPPTGPGNHPAEIHIESLPQVNSGYSFGQGLHTLTFKLADSDEIIFANWLTQNDTSFSIFFSRDTQITSPIVYPNPFIEEITFDFNTLKDISLFKEDVIITIYDQNGKTIDQIEKKYSNNSKIVYSNNTLPKGRYYYIITSSKGQKIDSGILIKQ